MVYHIFIMILKIYLLDCRDILLDTLLNSKYISPLEKLSFDKYKDEKTKKEKIASAFLKNKYVGEYHLNENGKPISDHIFFNVSHSECLVALVLDSTPIGIDIEKIRPVDAKLSDYVTDVEEKKYVHDDESFFEIWTNKEALTKCVGTGIKGKVNTIPGLPINNYRQYMGKNYYNKTVKYLDYIITISRESKQDFSIEIIKEVI